MKTLFVISSLMIFGAVLAQEETTIFPDSSYEDSEESLEEAALEEEECRMSEPEFLSDPVSEEVKIAVNSGEREFGVNFIKYLFDDFKKVSKVDRNIFVSPASIYQTLMLAYFGARGETAADLQKLMGFNLTREDVVKNYLFERAFQTVRDLSGEAKGYDLRLANKVYFDRKYELNDCLTSVLNEELEAVDFGKAEKTRQVINNWVSGQTNEKIPELLAKGALENGENKVALVNAAYFKGQWMSKFDSANTKANNFYIKRDQITVTEFMEQKGKFNYYTSEELRAHVLEMPYIGEEVSLVLILPPFEEDSLIETVNRLNADTLRGVMAEIQSGFFSVDDLKVRIPKIKIEQTFDIKKALSEMGAEKLFESTGDLTGFLSSDSNEEVSFGNAIHKSFIDVNEEGSEAAAATAVFGFRSARPLFHTEFIADHPFMFMIYDKPSDTILFFGVYQNPKLEN